MCKGMSRVLAWHDDGEMPRCEILLASGERVTVTLSAHGVQIDRLRHDSAPNDILFAGNVDVATDICVGLLGTRSARSTTPLNVLASAIVRMPSAAAVRSAFGDAARGLAAKRSSEALPRAIVVAILLLAFVLAARTAYEFITR
jgi:hypothetical protein